MYRQACSEVFKQPWYIVLTLLVASGFSIVTLLWDNIALLRYSWSVGSVKSLFDLWWGLLAATPHSMGWFAVGVVILTATLLGMIVSMSFYAWRKKRGQGSWNRLLTSTGTGTLAAVLGVGCLACGPLLVGSLLALFGATGLLLLLPLHGAELGLLAILLLLYSLHTLAKVITAPAVCAVE